MIVLSIDSASKVATAALLSENALIAEYTLNNKMEHSTLI
ncbi:tRNA (adenosine(37)-N6)-threonylcarbamoyltransferase complex dimerization subunit type 1 TsaB, partial [Clostridium perfringens]|nr:tRNA (adenosine(37)-N6)-threonylcarbamoyltransferase complex dimerization subunit type 1 TsaB [Clostridium perfringens]